MPIYSTIQGNSSDVLPPILELYVQSGARILDCTYNKGTFWKKAGNYQPIRSDLGVFPNLDVRADLARLPFRNGSLDVLVLDPPYGNMSTVARTDHMQGPYALKMVRTPTDVMDLYRDGIDEAERVLSPGGVLIVKCQDAVNSGRQVWFSVKIYNYAIMCSFEGIDRFHQLPHNRPHMRHNTQKHSRKWGSTWWVFRSGKT
jgi:hypothetical protein